jgi:hypothetical protein
LGNGDGTFAGPFTYAAGVHPASVAVGDLSGDGIPDLVVANRGVEYAGNSSVSVFLGNGDGTFQSALSFPASDGYYYPVFVALGDFNADGKLDVITANRVPTGGVGEVAVLLGNGDGTLQAPVRTATSFAGPVAVAVADFNGDGIPDVVAPIAGVDGFVVVLAGNGDGTFHQAAYYQAGGYPNGLSSVAVGDFNGDGIADFAVAGSVYLPSYQGNVSVFLGKGDGTFQPGRNYLGGRGPVALTAADLNGDSLPDLVTANFATDSVSVLLNNADWGPPAATVFPGGSGDIPPDWAEPADAVDRAAVPESGGIPSFPASRQLILVRPRPRHFGEDSLGLTVGDGQVPEDSLAFVGELPGAGTQGLA